MCIRDRYTYRQPQPFRPFHDGVDYFPIRTVCVPQWIELHRAEPLPGVALYQADGIFLKRIYIYAPDEPSRKILHDFKGHLIVLAAESSPVYVELIHLLYEPFLRDTNIGPASYVSYMGCLLYTSRCV